MPAHMFCFGYETPAQHYNNRAHEWWDDADSRAVFIDCDSEDEALKWGCEIAERFVAQLWIARGEPVQSWKAGRFAYWIETDTDRIASALTHNVPVVRAGEFPELR